MEVMCHMCSYINMRSHAHYFWVVCKACFFSGKDDVAPLTSCLTLDMCSLCKLEGWWVLWVFTLRRASGYRSRTPKKLQMKLDTWPLESKCGSQMLAWLCCPACPPLHLGRIFPSLGCTQTCLDKPCLHIICMKSRCIDTMECIPSWSSCLCNWFGAFVCLRYLNHRYQSLHVSCESPQWRFSFTSTKRRHSNSPMSHPRFLAPQSGCSIHLAWCRAHRQRIDDWRWHQNNSALPFIWRWLKMIEDVHHQVDALLTAASEGQWEASCPCQ